MKVLRLFARCKVESGLYNNASEVIRNGLRLLIERDAIAKCETVGAKEKPCERTRSTMRRVLTRFVLKYTLRAAHLELGGVKREVRRGGKP